MLGLVLMHQPINCTSCRENTLMYQQPFICYCPVPHEYIHTYIDSFTMCNRVQHKIESDSC